jgi:hypothetical protein
VVHSIQVEFLCLILKNVLRLTMEGHQLFNRFGVDILFIGRGPRDLKNPRRIWATDPLGLNYVHLTGFFLPMTSNFLQK